MRPRSVRPGPRFDALSARVGGMLRRASRPKRAGSPGAIPQPARDERLYVIGDLHGRCDLLDAMLDACLADIDARAGDGRRSRLIVVGDMIDRGDHTRDVLERLSALQKTCEAGACVLLKGNHEAALLRFLDAPDTGGDWLRFGGMQTLASYGLPLPAGEPDGDGLRALAAQLHRAMGAHVDLIRGMALTFRSGNVVCVHAGLDPDDPEARDERVLLWGRSRFLEQPGGIDGVFVIHGHHDAAEPVIAPGRVCVDIGAYHSSRLAAVRIDDEMRVMVVGA